MGSLLSLARVEFSYTARPVRKTGLFHKTLLTVNTGDKTLMKDGICGIVVVAIEP